MFVKTCIVAYNPADESTYPSVCQTPEEVERRFGFVGGETLLFDARGKYVGQLVNQLDEEAHGGTTPD